MLTIRISAAVLLIVGAGLVHGRWTNRWRPSPELAMLAARFDSIPIVIGDWQGTAFELPPEVRAMVGAVACVSRKYSNPARGVSVTVLLLGGLPADIGNHTPDICYPFAGYTLNATSPFDYHYGTANTRAGFRTALATRGGVSPSVLRLLWGWNASKGWTAPEDPRWSFASKPWLCKLYVIRETAGSAVKPEDDPCMDFLSVFLSEVDRLVFDFPKKMAKAERNSTTEQLSTLIPVEAVCHRSTARFSEFRLWTSIRITFKGFPA
jgi:Protein of unknown function (DUF3485)